MYGFTLIFMLAFIGGLIAYFGDKIGMKVGRKRLTLFGIRPKYTGIIITIFTGIFISVASIAILTIASDDVRIALFEMKEIQATLATNQQQLNESMKIMNEMEESLATIVAERDRAEADLLRAEADLADLELRRSQLYEEYNKLDENFKELAATSLLFESQIRFSNMALRADSLIYAEVVEGSDDLESIYNQLNAILMRADEIAYQLGARIDDQSRSAIVIDQNLVNFVAHVIQQDQGLHVVRVIAETNTLVGEPVIAYIGLIANDIIFKADDVLAEVIVDLDIVQDVDRQILNLLNVANAVAVSEGMITNIYGGAVEVVGDEFLNAITKAQTMSGEVIIKAIAIEDTFAAIGPLQIRLEVVQGES